MMVIVARETPDESASVAPEARSAGSLVRPAAFRGIEIRLAGVGLRLSVELIDNDYGAAAVLRVRGVIAGAKQEMRRVDRVSEFGARISPGLRAK